MIINGDYMTSGSASKLLGIHKTTIFNWEKLGVLTPIRFPIGSETYRAYRRSDLEELKKNMQPYLDSEPIDKRKAYRQYLKDREKIIEKNTMKKKEVIVD